MLEPLVSCVMVTQASRKTLAERAVRCFHEQSYSNRELVIVSDDQEALIEGDGVRVVLAPNMSLGDLRNYAVARTRGAFVAQWDDDDWFHPERIFRQLTLLEQHPNVDACLLRRITCAWPARNFYAISPPRPWECSALIRRQRLPVYPALARGEDSAALEGLVAIPLDEPDLYIRQIHGENTWDEAHFEPVMTWPHVSDPTEIKTRLGI